MPGSSIASSAAAKAGASWNAPPSTSVTGSIRSNLRKPSTACSGAPISRSIPKLTATWPPVSPRPAVRLPRSFIAMARRTPPNSMHGMTTGWAAKSGRDEPRSNGDVTGWEPGGLSLDRRRPRGHVEWSRNAAPTEVRMTAAEPSATGQKPALKVLLCSPRGFCAGVVRAIDTVEQALARYGAPVYVRHEIVHNRYVVESLKAKGAIFVEEL